MATRRAQILGTRDALRVAWHDLRPNDTGEAVEIGVRDGAQLHLDFDDRHHFRFDGSALGQLFYSLAKVPRPNFIRVTSISTDALPRTARVVVHRKG